MDNTERIDSIYVDNEEVGNPSFIEYSGEPVATSSSLPPQRKRPLNNQSSYESDGCKSKRFKIVSEKRNTGGLNENLAKFIPDKDVKEAILLKLPRAENIDPVKNLDDFLLELIKQKKKTVDITIDGTFEKIQDKETYIIGPLSRLWVLNENAYSGKDSNAPVVQMDTVLQLLEKTVVLIGQCSNTITYERHKNAPLGVTRTSTTLVVAMLKEKESFRQKHEKALFGKKFTGKSIETIPEMSRPNNRQPFRGSPSQNKMGGGQIQCHNNTSKTLTFKNYSTSLRSARKFKTFSTCLETTCKRSKCLVLTRMVQDLSATRNKANIFPKTSTMEQRSERTDRLESERYIGERS